MRTVELAKVAAAAEGLHLRRIARRQAMRAAYGVGAAIFGIAILIMVHVLIYIGLRYLMQPIWAALIVFVLDLAAAGALGYLAISNQPDSVELEAIQVRDQALHEMKRSLTAMALAAEVGGAIVRSRARAGVKRSAAGAVAEFASRFIGR